MFMGAGARGALPGARPKRHTLQLFAFIRFFASRAPGQTPRDGSRGYRAAGPQNLDRPKKIFYTWRKAAEECATGSRFSGPARKKASPAGPAARAPRPSDRVMRCPLVSVHFRFRSTARLPSNLHFRRPYAVQF